MFVTQPARHMWLTQLGHTFVTKPGHKFVTHPVRHMLLTNLITCFLHNLVKPVEFRTFFFEFIFWNSEPVDIGGGCHGGRVCPVRRALLAQVGEVLLHRVEKVVPGNGAALLLRLRGLVLPPVRDEGNRVHAVVELKLVRALRMRIQ